MGTFHVARSTGLANLNASTNKIKYPAGRKINFLAMQRHIKALTNCNNNASRMQHLPLQVQLRLVGATNLTAPSASVFATFSYGGTEVSKTDIVHPLSSPIAENLNNTANHRGNGRSPQVDTNPKLGVAAVAETASHLWTIAHGNTCVIPLPEACFDRREIEIEIDLWEDGRPKKERGNHLGQVSRKGPTYIIVRAYAPGAVVGFG